MTCPVPFSDLLIITGACHSKSLQTLLFLIHPTGPGTFQHHPSLVLFLYNIAHFFLSSLYIYYPPYVQHSRVQQSKNIYLNNQMHFEGVKIEVDFRIRPLCTQVCMYSFKSW